MRTDFYYESQCGGKIHGCRWIPAGEPKAVLQIVHGIAEHVERYDHFANYLNHLGYLVVAEDHMGHGGSVSDQAPKGCFSGGWFGAVEDSYRLLQDTKKEFPDLPYVIFGHSMGSFMTRTILSKYPDSGIVAAILCGTGWQPAAALAAGRLACLSVCRKEGEQSASGKISKMCFGNYNKRVEHQRTEFDWLSRDNHVVDEYIADPDCGFTASAGLMRDMLEGIAYNQSSDNLKNMKKELPVFLISGGDDPVGDYGKGVTKTRDAFEKAGMTDVSMHLYPLCRHEILNEINKEEVYEDITRWMEPIVNKMVPLR